MVYGFVIFVVKFTNIKRKFKILNEDGKTIVMKSPKNIIEEYEKRTKALVLRRVHKMENKNQRKLFKKRVIRRRFSIGDIIFITITPSTGFRKFARVTKMNSGLISADFIFGDNIFNFELHKKLYIMGKARKEERRNFVKQLEQIEAMKFAEAL
jgi:hypothetical protein